MLRRGSSANHVCSGQAFDRLVEITEEPLTRRQARAIEQVLIEENPQFSNNGHSAFCGIRKAIDKNKIFVGPQNGKGQSSSTIQGGGENKYSPINPGPLDINDASSFTELQY